MMLLMSCLAIIRSARDEMSANEKKLADFILENAPLIRDYSSQQLAASVGVSQSSVVKFSQKLGYKGFTDLKLAIHETVIKQGTNVAMLHSVDQSDKADVSPRQRLFRNKCDALSSATDLNDDTTVLAAVAAIESAARVQVIGMGSAYIIAKDLSFKLMSLGKPVISEGDAQLQISGVATLRRGDCLLAISSSGQEPALIEIVKQAKKAGVAIISMTNQGANPVGALSSIRLYSVSRGADVDLPGVIAAASQQHVVDMLYYSLMHRDGRLNPKAAQKGGAQDA
ncbi:MAG: MurR/RpiR family transcriptional regulator [Pseudomonadota bacterium]